MYIDSQVIKHFALEANLKTKKMIVFYYILSLPYTINIVCIITKLNNTEKKIYFIKQS